MPPSHCFGSTPNINTMKGSHFLAFDDKMKGSGQFSCAYCKKSFKTGRSLTQHQEKNKICCAAYTSDMARKHGNLSAYQGLVFATNKRSRSGEILTDGSNVLGNLAKKRKQQSEFRPPQDITALKKQIRRDKKQAELDAISDEDETESEEDEEEEDDNEEDNNGFVLDENTSSDDNISSDEGANDDNMPLDPTEEAPITFIRDNFKEYVAYARQNMLALTRSQVKAVELLTMLRQTKAPLESYDNIMAWHLKELATATKTGTRNGYNRAWIPQKQLFDHLRARYNAPKNMSSQVIRITLPSSGVHSDVIRNNVLFEFQKLLSDPRIQQKDYLFWGDNPFAPPPERLNYIKDLNTGQCYIESWKRLITKPGKQVLLPTPMYFDGCATMQFVDRPITAVRFALGIFTCDARNKDHMWGTLGYIPKIRADEGRGRRMLLESGHHDGFMTHQEYAHHEATQGHDKQVDKAQDWQAQVNCILEEFIKLQKTGFIWDLHYNGRVYKDVEFVIFTPFLKLDSAEADKACGKYTSRGKGVAHLCRYCHCPTNKSEYHMMDFPFKTVAQIQALVDAGDLEGLQKISQCFIKNAFYRVRFGLHNDRGVHGACPMEMLHMILLGLFQYVRNMFFEQVGETSKTLDKINALSKEYGELFSRQSDRDFPKTRFGKGINGGKVTAKEYRGILLNMAAVLASTHGKELLRGKKITKKTNPTNFNHRGVLDDWIMLIETLLEWEQWLKSDEMLKKHVRALEYKQRYIMYLIRKVGKREKGMGLNTLKFHSIKHIAEQIIMFGKPMEYDTGSNEEGHKKTKTAAVLTQRKAEVFDYQTSVRKDEMYLLEMANEEIKGRAKWDYHLGHQDLDVPPPNNDVIKTGGCQVRCFRDENGVSCFEYLTTFDGKATAVLENELIEFVVGLEESLGDYCPNNLVVKGTHKRNGVTFRAQGKFMGKLWRDWALVDWGEDDGRLPCRLWGFLDLTFLPENTGVSYGGLEEVQGGIYAIVESAYYITNTKPIPVGHVFVNRQQKQVTKSSIFTAIRKTVAEVAHGNVTRAQLYLADVEAFVAPVCVVPDIGGTPYDYMVVKNTREWRENFMDWLEANPADDYMEDLGDTFED